MSVSVTSENSFRKLTPEDCISRPPMGWNSWDCFGASVTEDEVRANALYMQEDLLAYGWDTVVVDIQWYEGSADGWVYHDFAGLSLDGYGRPQPDLLRFPSAAGGRGFKPLADYVHGLGLKFGLHMMRGVPRQAVHQNLPIEGGQGMTCRQAAAQASICRWNTDMYGCDPSRPAAAAWYDSLYRMFASWGVDYVKVDDIAWNFIAEDHYPAGEVELIARAIQKAGRPMVLSLSPGPAVFEKREHLAAHANLWRMTDDFWDEWPLLLRDIERCHVWQGEVGPGCWPDADMLPLGRLRMRNNGGEMSKFTPDEQRLVMNLWSVFRSPLMMGGHLPANDAWTLELLTNRGLLGLNREGGWPRELLYSPEGLIAWTQTEDASGEPNCLLLINPTDRPLNFRLELGDAEWRVFGTEPWRLRELWAEPAGGSGTDGEEEMVWSREEALQGTIRPHASLIYRAARN